MKRYLICFMHFCVILGCSTPQPHKLTDTTRIDNNLSPADAWEKASPYLEANFRFRCARHAGDHWCKKKPADHIFSEGSYYFVCRESYPYKTINAYLINAIRVHKRTGAIELPQGQQ